MTANDASHHAWHSRAQCPETCTACNAESRCTTCRHSRVLHYAERGECLYSTEAETWACGCHEYQAAR